jgi:hypothetical protein
MSDVALEYTRAARAEVGARVGALAGIASAAMFFIGTAILNVPHDVSDTELVRWWSSNSHQVDALISMVSFTLAGLLFLVFLAYLRARLLAAEGGAGTLTTIVFSAGMLFVATLFIAAAARGVVTYALKSPVGGETLPGVDLLRYLPEFSYVVLGLCGLLSAALAIAVTSLLAFKTRAFGRVVAWLGVLCSLALVVANIALVGVGAIPAVLLWTTATSIALWRQEPRNAQVGT